MKKNVITAVCLFLAGTIFVVSCSQRNEVVPSGGAKSAQSKNRSGEELYRSVFFLEGDLAKDIPSYQRYTENVAKVDSNVLAIREDIIAGIKTNKPEFFNEFKAKLESKDYDQIQKALDQGRSVFMESALTSEKYGEYFAEMLEISKKNDLSKIDVKTDEGKKELQEIVAENMKSRPDAQRALYCNLGLACAVAVALAVWEVVAFVNVAAFGSIYAYALAVQWGPDLSSNGGGGSETAKVGNLYDEKLIAEISDAI